jgi:probable HAF family extracellular repeat protein
MKKVHRFNLRSFLLGVAFLAGLGCATLASAQHAYLIDLNSKTATDLGTLGGDHSATYAISINDTGQVVGYSYVATAEGPETHAFITGPDGAGMRDLGPLHGWSRAFGINEVGQVVGGSSDTAIGVPRAFITGPDGKGMRDLGTLGGGDSSSASDVNNAGQVVGSSDAGPSDEGFRRSHAFITGPDGVGMRDIDTLGGASQAYAINNAGRVVGTALLGAFITGPDGTSMRVLGGNSGDASDINDAGQVVGLFSMAGGGYHAFITGPNGMDMRDLGTLSGGSSRASGINEAGQVVGQSDTPDGATHTFVATHAFITGPNGGPMNDLNSLIDLPGGIILTSATGINNSGQVIANGTILGIPEPKTYALLLAGLALITAVAWRKKHIGPFPVPC